MFRKTLFLTSSLFVALSAGAASAQTLEQTLGMALANHPQVESAKAAVDTSKQDIREQKSGYFPEVAVNATGGRIYGDNSTSRGLSTTRGSGYSYLWEGGASVNQMIFDGHETSSRVKSAVSMKHASDIGLQGVREDLAFRTVQTYINLIRSRLGYQLILNHEANVKSYLDRIRSMVDEGAADETELQQARDVSIILDNFRADYQGQLRAAESEYFELTGLMPEGDLFQPPSVKEFLPASLDSALVSAAEHPAIRAIAMQVRSRAYDKDAEQAALYPDVNGELSYLERDQRDVIGGEATDARALVKMNWAFETGGAQLARIKKRSIEHQDLMYRKQDAQRQIERGVRLAYAELDTAQIQNTNQDKRLDLNQKLLETYKSQFEGARVSLLQLMQVDNQLFNTKLEKINAQHRLLLAEYGILSSLGRLQNSLGLDGSVNVANSNAPMQETPSHDQTKTGQ